MDEEKKLNETEVPELPDSTADQKRIDAPEIPADSTAPVQDTPVEKAPADAPETEAQPAPAADTDADARAAAIDEMEKASQKALDAMREAGNEKNEEVIEDAEKKLEDIFDQLKTWMESNTQPDRIRAEMKTAADAVTAQLEKTRQAVIEVSQSEQFKQTMQSGKDFILGTGAMIADGLQYGYDKLLEVPEFRKAADFVGEKVDTLRHSEALKTIVDRSQESLNHFSDAIFDGLKSFFSEPAAPAHKDDLPDLPEDNDTDPGVKE